MDGQNAGIRKGKLQEWPGMCPVSHGGFNLGLLGFRVQGFRVLGFSGLRV